MAQSNGDGDDDDDIPTVTLMGDSSRNEPSGRPSDEELRQSYIDLYERFGWDTDTLPAANHTDEDDDEAEKSDFR